MGQERLSHFALLSMENSLARHLNYSSIINDFGLKKGKEGEIETEVSVVAVVWCERGIMFHSVCIIIGDLYKNYCDISLTTRYILTVEYRRFIEELLRY